MKDKRISLSQVLLMIATIVTSCFAITLSAADLPYPYSELKTPENPIHLSDDFIRIRNDNVESLRKKGYMEKLDEAPRAEYVQARMEERKAMAKFSSSPSSAQALGFIQVIGGLVPDVSSLPFFPTMLPQSYLSTGSQSYLLEGGDMLKQLHTLTAFGTLLIDEMTDVTMMLDQPNILIAGEPAKLIQVKHKDSKWATVVYAPRGRRLFIVEADRRLDGELKGRFIKMIEGLSVSPAH